MTKKKETVLKEKDEQLLVRADFNRIKFTHTQLSFFKTIQNNFLTVCSGPAGSSKTFTACYAALDSIERGIYKKIILTRPVVESGENLGFIPGSVDEKIAPYMKGFISNMGKITSPEKVKYLTSKNIIIQEPIAFMRSETYDDTILLLDEAQNCDIRQLMLVVTRMGINSKIVICGDVTQWDIDKRRNDLLIFTDKIINNVESCAHFEFKREDIVRNPMLIKITDKYEEYQIEAGIKK